MIKTATNEELRDHLNNLTIWAIDKGYHVSFEENGDNCICWMSKIIEINSSAPLKNQVYCLLHECGHALIFDNGAFWDYNKKNHLPNKNTNMNKVLTVIEEVEAWERGYKLAQRLNIPLSKKEWEEQMLDAIKKYIDWAAD